MCRLLKKKANTYKVKTKELPWVLVAKGELGVHEIRGRKHNDRILEYHDATSLDASSDETPWCASYLNWVLKQCKIKGTNSARARSFINWGVKLDEPKIGAIAVFWRKSKTSRSGHVGFYLGEDKNKVGNFLLLSGNQANAVTIKSYSRERLLCFVFPKGY